MKYEPAAEGTVSADDSADVLVVDDDPTFLSAILPALRSNGLTVEVAEDPADACRLLERKTYSVVSVALLFKQESGFAVIDSIAALEKRPNVVVITAADPSILGRIDRNVVKTILFKPINADQVGAYMHLLAAA